MSKAGKAGRASGMVRYSTFLRPDQIEALKVQHDRSGVPVAEQIRRAIDAALGLKPAARRRA